MRFWGLGCSRIGEKGQAGGEDDGWQQLEEDRDAPAPVLAGRAVPEGHAVANPADI